MDPKLSSRPWLAPLLLLTAVVVAYAPSLGNGFVYDDHDVIVAQPRPASVVDGLRVFAEPHFLGLPYYRPITRATLLGQKAAHGDRPAPFHAFNIALAGLAALAALALLRTPALRLEPATAALAAGLFALHPAASSCVYPIASGRETLLPAVLMLAAVVAFVREHRAGALALLAAALFAKEQAVVTPLLFLLADACRVSARPPDDRLRAWAARHAPAFGLLAGYLAVRAWVLGGGGAEIAFLDDPLKPLLSYVFALQTGVAPFRSVVYEPELAVWWSTPRALLAIAAAGALVAGCARARLGAPGTRWLAFWIGWFVVAQLPTANWLRQEAPFAERYTFVAGLALPALAASLVSAHWGSVFVRRAALGAAAVCIAAAAFITLERAATFRDDVAFATAWLRTNPESAEAHHLLGVMSAQDGLLEKAVAHYERALSKPGGATSADLQANLGTALAMLGRGPAARLRFEQAIRLQPGHPEAHANLGALLAADGRPEEAIAHYREALRTAPTLASAHNNLASALARRGDGPEAEAHWREALRLEPGYVDALANLSRWLAQRGDDEEALELLRRLEAARPGDPDVRRRIRLIEER